MREKRKLKSIIFYPLTPSGIELKESVARYLWYVKDEQVIDEVSLTADKYFDLVYPERYKEHKLYFIFDAELYIPPSTPKEDIYINNTGLLLCALYELKIHNIQELHILNFQKEVFKAAHFPIKEDEKNKSKGSTNSANQPNNQGPTMPQPIFINYDDNKQTIEIEEYTIVHGHPDIKDLIEKIMEKILFSLQTPSKNSQGSKSEQSHKEQANSSSQSEQNQKNEKKFIYILIIDDVIGDYNRKFFQFYAWLKNEFMKIGIIPIIKGIAGPDELVDYLKSYPFDVVFIDIDFTKYFEKEVRKKRNGAEVEKIEFDKTSYYYRLLEEILRDVDIIKNNKKLEIDEKIKEKGPLILGFIILEQLISVLRTGLSKVNNINNCNWYILTSYRKKDILPNKINGKDNMIKWLKERWIEKKEFIKNPSDILKIFEKIPILNGKLEQPSLRDILKLILASKYMAINQSLKHSGIFYAFGISVESEKELLEEAKEIEADMKKTCTQDISIYTGEEALDENDFIKELNKEGTDGKN